VTVVARRVVSSPVRSATESWGTITNILAPTDGAARKELARISGVACSLIASEAPTNDAIVIWGNGPRVRVYCLFGDAAISAEDKNEDALATCPTEGDWSMSLPCPSEDLTWVQRELVSQSTHITARKLGDPVPEEEPEADVGSSTSKSTSSVNEDAFFRP
jgi:hypothetical protein